MGHFFTTLAAGLLSFSVLSTDALADGGRVGDGGGFGSGTSVPDEPAAQGSNDSPLVQVIRKILLTYENGASAEVDKLHVAVSGFVDLSVTIEVRFVTLSDNFFERIGTDFDFNIDDETPDEANRVGNAYRAGQDSLFLALNSSVVEKSATPLLDFSSISLINRDNLIELDEPDFSQPLSQRDLNIALGELGQLGSVRTLTAPKVDLLNNSVVTGSLNEADYEGESKLPFVSEIPILKRFFVGTVHQDARRNLLILVKPHVLIESEQE